MPSAKLILLFSISQQHVDQVLFRAFLSPKSDRTRKAIAFHSSEPTSQFQNHTAEIKQQRIRVRKESERGEEISISFSFLGAVATWPIFPGPSSPKTHILHLSIFSFILIRCMRCINSWWLWWWQREWKIAKMEYQIWILNITLIRWAELRFLLIVWEEGSGWH